MNQGEDVEQERDEIEHYLRTLRKKVDHQIKNPFELAFANYSFAELATWKNNVLQLDATSKLYGQRVDFLHCGTMQILGSVLNKDMAQQNTHEQRQDIRKEQIYDHAPHQRNLEEPHRLNGEVAKMEANILIWKEVCKKRDALRQLMMNQLALDHQLRLAFFASDIAAKNRGGDEEGEGEEERREEGRDEELAVYLKLLDFRRLSLGSLGIYREIEEAVSDANVFMINFSGKAKERAQTVKIQSFMDFDFQALEKEPLTQLRPFNLGENTIPDGQYLSPVAIVQPFQPQSASQHSEDQSEYSFELQNWNKVDKVSKPSKSKKPRKTRRKEMGGGEQRRQEMIDFKGINPLRSEVLQREGEEGVEKYLHPRDYLLVKFVKYTPLFAKQKKHRRGGGRSKTRQVGGGGVHRSRSQSQSQVEILPQPYGGLDGLQTIPEESFENNQNELSLRTSLQRPQRQHFKEAALPIKQMKKKIKQQRTCQSQLAFGQIKTIFSNEQPLDIFISILHVAAEEQIMISI